MATLMRSRTDRKIAGVCGGLAEQNGWDSTLVRLVWVALVLFAGTGVLIYVLMWIIVPEAPYGVSGQAHAAPPNPPVYQGPPNGPYEPPTYDAPRYRAPHDPESSADAFLKR